MAIRGPFSDFATAVMSAEHRVCEQSAFHIPDLQTVCGSSRILQL